MKIAMVGLRGIGPQIAGGIERHVEELAVRMAAYGHSVTVFGRSPYVREKDASYRGVRLLGRPVIPTKHLETISHTALCLPSLCHGYDIVHFHAVGPSLCTFVPRLLGRKVVATIHGLDFQRAKWGGIARAALRTGAWAAGRFPNETIVVSRKLRQYYQEVFKRKTWYIPNGVNVPVRRELAILRDKFGLEKDGYFLSLGRLTPEKGLHYLIPAFRRLDTPLKLVVAGMQGLGDDYAKRLRELAGDDRRILFPGALYGEEKDEAFSNAFAFVLPSELEGMPIAMLEAMSYGCPVLASGITECAEIWQAAGEENGIDLCRHFRALDPDDLHRGLTELIADPKRSEMAREARDYVLERYNWDAIVGETLEVYGLALGPVH